MTFKHDWEKTNLLLHPSAELIKAMISKAFPNKKMRSYECISGGCANLNSKVYLDSDINPYILRLYLRDADASYREQQLSLLLRTKIPIPEVYFIGHYEGYQFAITQYLPGITVRDLLLSNQVFNIEQLMYDIGILAAKIHVHTFTKPGFFDQQLQIKHLPQTSYIEHACECLKNVQVILTLSPNIISKLSHYLNQLDSFFPSQDERSLVHGDFDPANILVAQQDNQWKVSGILDWEFAFSGSPLFDIANMLRYTHHLPSAFESSFLKGLTLNYSLPKNWQTTIHLLNLLSLLDCLARSSAHHRNQQADIYQLIAYIINQFDKEYDL